MWGEQEEKEGEDGQYEGREVGSEGTRKEWGGNHVGAKKRREMVEKTGEVRGVPGDPGKKHLRPSYEGPKESGPMARILGTMLRTLEPKKGMWPSPRPEESS